MTLEEARVAGEIEGLRVALRVLVDAIGGFENGTEMISVLRAAAFDAVDAASKIGKGTPIAATIDAAERETLEFIFSGP